MKTISMMMMSLVVMALSLTSCSKSVDSPAGEFAQCINEMTDKFADCKDMADLQKLAQESTNVFDKFQDAKYTDYTLTDADKDCLKDALNSYAKVLIKVMGEIYNEKIPDGALEQAQEMSNRMIDNSTTLGDILSGGAMAF
jgi:hypothetical protein